MMKKIYIVLFSILYLSIAVISCIHAYEFFGLANHKVMAAVLSGAFEVGQAAVLFALLTSDKERNKIMPWVLMVIFTLVQIMGNIYACYKHIMIYSQDLLRYFKEPIFIWANLPDDQATVIVTYIVAAILPICGLLLTSMVTNFLDKTDNKVEQKEQSIPSNEENYVEQNIEEKQFENEETLDESDKVDETPPQVIEQENENVSQDVEDIIGGNIIPQSNYTPNKQKSHFINI